MITVTWNAVRHVSYQQGFVCRDAARGRDGAWGGGTTPVLNTEDCHHLVAELRRRGVSCEDPVKIPGLLTYCTFYDPDGNRLQAVSPA